ncbi:hypothetical protein G8O24_21990 [Bradyrhizobium sp. INPA01-394B]|uniref:Uncharacterized protein n=2 Tax=Nitrobacteraceae TaxID=41294 RepID=A0A7C9VI49_9BRAD|nr:MULTISPECIES: hypothetical protein [Bradyrhizobium]NGX97726.1 hypothetical protein [Candidatus Afipia apatlaquensis]MBC9880009.1 hypothetical protein [Bradyrhizobium campsiandrae]MBC9977359.1 hypothetical protein [Bradyrhizobium campsiandrae]MBR1090556.1 hypothetical protein [Bradyrhizobium manausense]MDU0957333.1 hypothetical protein [Bradyrhizobium sp.]
MAGWMVTVAVVRENDELGHEMYAVAIDDPAQAAQFALKVANSDAAVVDGEIDEASIKSIGLKPGDLMKVLDETSDPLTSNMRRH